MNKIVIRENACIGCGACIAVDPEHFDFNEDGFAVVTNNDNIETNAVNNALASCPTSAIYLEEASSQNCECGENCECGDDCNCTEDDKCSEDCECGE